MRGDIASVDAPTFIGDIASIPEFIGDIASLLPPYGDIGENGDIAPLIGDSGIGDIDGSANGDVM